MALSLSVSPVQQFTDNNGIPLAGGLLFTYAAGTTTKQAAYTDSTGATALPNPIVLNARGEVSPSAAGVSCGLWLTPSLAYKMVLALPGDTDPPSNPIWTVDNINPGAVPVTAGQSWQEIAVFTPAAATQQAVPLPSQYRRFRITMQGVIVANNAVTVALQVSTDGGSTYKGSSYAFANPQLDETGTVTSNVNASNSSLVLASPVSNTSSSPMDSVLEIFPGSAALYPRIDGRAFYNSSTGHYITAQIGGTWFGGPALVNYALIFLSSGTFSGTIILEGLP